MRTRPHRQMPWHSDRASTASPPYLHARHPQQKERGATVIEYMLIAILVSVVAFLALTSIGQQSANMVAPAASALEGN